MRLTRPIAARWPVLLSMREAVGMGLAAIKAYKLRASLTILGVVMGIMTVTGMSSIVAGLNRSIADAGWGQFRAILFWQATKAGKSVVPLPASDTTQRCSDCGAKAKPRVELSDREFRCRSCGLVLGRDRNAARNLNPDRPGPDGRAEPSGEVPVGDDGSKTLVPAGPEAA